MRDDLDGIERTREAEAGTRDAPASQVRPADPADLPDLVRGRTLVREARIIRAEAPAEGEDDRTVEVAFSSAEPVETWFGLEVLGHDAGNCDLSRFADGRGPVLVDHDRRDHVGVVVSARIDKDKVGRAVLRFGKGARASEILADIRDGIRSNISVGYRIGEIELIKDGEDVEPVYRINSWMPYEISVVSVPADASVGVGRSAAAAMPGAERPPNGRAKGMDEETTTTAGNENGNGNNEGNDRKRSAPTTTPATPAKPADAKAVRDAELSRIREIEAIGVKAKMTDAARKAIEDGTTVDEFRKLVLDTMAETPGVGVRKAKPGEDAIGMSGADLNRFSFTRALHALANPNDKRAQDRAGFERECSAEVSKRLQREPQGIFIPADVTRDAGAIAAFNREAIRIGRRDLVVGTPTAGGNLVSTDLLASSFIELLRNRAVLVQAGAIVLGDLVGNVAIPSQTGAATAYWIATEGGAPTEGQQVIGQVGLSPKTVGAYTDYSRQLLIQSSIDIEMFVRNDLTRILALAIDLAGLYGAGSGGAPLGLTGISGVGLTDFAAVLPTYAEIVDMETDVATANADMGALSYLVAPNIRGHAKTTPKFSGGDREIWEAGNMINGYPAVVSNQVTASHMWFGNWADFIIGLWGGLDLTIDPYTASTTGTVRVVALQSVDVDVRHAASFDWGYQATP